MRSKIKCFSINRDCVFNFRISNLLCALGYSQLKRLENIKKKRERIFKFYSKNINKGNLKIQLFKKNLSPLYWTFSIFIVSKSFKRNNLIKFLKNFKIETRNGFYSSNKLKYFKKNKNLINSDFLSERVINLPIFEELNFREQKYIVQKLNQFFK